MKEKLVPNVKWIFIAALFLVSLFMDNRYVQDIFILTFLWAGLGCAWNLSCGYSHRLSIGHSAFVGLGAYTSTILYVSCGVSPWIGMAAGAVISGIVALGIGKATLGLRGTFFTFATIAFAEILRIFTTTARGLTGGALGILIPYKPGLLNMTWNDKQPFLIICFVYMVVLLIISVRLEKSRFGYHLVAIGEDRQAAETLGVNSRDVMTKSFVLSAMTTSVGGTIMAQYILFIDPESVMGMNTISLQFVLICLIGGMGRAFGPFAGALILLPLATILRGYLSNISGLHGWLYGLFLLAVVLYKPEGIIGPVGRLYHKITVKLGLEGGECK